jgi:Cof subfamily protein (haloacid dehalogenase superfamily)
VPERGAPPFKVVALDIDGTLLRSDRTVSLRTTAALKGVAEAGSRLVLVTGRRYPAARRVAALFGGDPPFVLHNGALVIDGGEILHREFLPLATAREVIRRGEDQHPVAHVGPSGEGLVFAREGHSRTLAAYSLDPAHPDVRSVPDLGGALAADPVQVMFGGAIPEVEGLEARLAEALPGAVRLEKTLYPAAGLGLLDVLHPRVSKARALGLLLERWGVPWAETLGIGDNWNDRAFLERVGLGLVMGNAAPGLKALGFPVLPTNDDDGVAVALERHVLGLG